MDLTSLSLGKLNTLNQRIAREIEVRERVGKADVIKKLRKLAAAEGFSLEELPVFDADAPASHAAGLVGLDRSANQGEGSEFHGIRPFQSGDRLRRVHWPR